MPTVADLSAPYGNFMLAPRRGRDVCDTCFNLTDGYGRCYACAHGGRWLDAVVPISYSVGGEQLHHALAAYKRAAEPVARRFTLELAAVLWRFLARHERCVAAAVGVQAFPLVTTVPSSDPARDELHPLHRIAGELVVPTRARYQRLLTRVAVELPPPSSTNAVTDAARVDPSATNRDADPPSSDPNGAPHAPAGDSDSTPGAHEFDPSRFAPTRRLDHEPVLLIDDTWTTGANAQSAAAALKRAGAGPVGAVVIGRYVNRGWGKNDRQLNSLSRPYDWDRCIHCVPSALCVI